MTLEKLRLLVERFSKRTDLRENNFIDDLIDLAAIHIGRDARMMELERIATLTVTDSVGMPADYMMMRSVSRPIPRGIRWLQPVTVAQFDQPADDIDVYMIKNGQINIHGTAELTLNYSVRPEKLVGDSDTNFVLTQYPTIYLVATLREVWTSALDAEAFEHADGRYLREIESINAHYDRQMLGNGASIKRVDK